MKARLLIILLLSLLPTILLSQEKSYSKREIEDMVNSYLYDSVTIKGRLLPPIMEKSNSPIIPISNGIINVFYANSFNWLLFPEIRENATYSYRSDKNGVFEFKLTRGKYILDIRSSESSSLYLLIDVNINKSEIEKGEIDLGDIKFASYHLNISLGYNKEALKELKKNRREAKIEESRQGRTKQVD